MRLGHVIAEVASGWSRDVEFAIFGTRDPDEIASLVDGFCASVLGSPIGRYRFFRSTIASVHGVELVDGRAVVVKAHQPHVPREQLSAIAHVQRTMWESGFPAPRPLAPPTPLMHATATAEVDLSGPWHDGHDPAFRRAMAETLAELVDRCRGIGTRDIRVDHFLTLPRDQLWPRPHSTVFDFEATAHGAERIDDAARAARAVLDSAADLPRVIGHTDWRAENLRFDGSRITAVYDWESLKHTPEAMLVGGAAFAFTADWSEPPSGRHAPSVEEARAFVGEYEQARGKAIEGSQRRFIGAAYLFGTAYVARCCHARDPEGAQEATDGFRTLIDDHGASLLELFE
jgi:hypothetical protein